MKRDSLILFPVIVLAGLFFFCQQAVSGDMYRYKDDQGHLNLVDSPSQIPRQYLNRVESVPSGKEAEKLNSELTKLILNGGNSDDINRYFDRYLFMNRWTFILLSLLILTFLFPVFFKNSLSRLNAVVSFLILLLLFHLFVFVPKIQDKVYKFSGIIRHISRVSLPFDKGIRQKVMVYRIYSEELPLIPVNIYVQLLKLRKLQQSFQVHK